MKTKHESYISLLNQLFGGKGDKMTLAKNVERPVPRNATPLSIGVEQKSFCDAIFGLSETLWLDDGFGERFIFSAARPYRYLYAETYINLKHLYFNICPRQKIQVYFFIQTQMEDKYRSCQRTHQYLSRRYCGHGIV